jgi:hypothetical protein
VDFKDFNALLNSHVLEMTSGQTHLFEVSIDKRDMWDTYMGAFPPGTNEVFRERREHDCNCCHNFIRDLGAVVAIKDNKVITIWDFQVGDDRFQPVVDAMALLIRSKAVKDVFLPTRRSFGTASNVEVYENGGFNRWYHFHAVLANSVRIYKEDDVGRVKGQMRDSRNVLKRSFQELTEDAIETVRDLISQGSLLYKGEEWSGPLSKFISIFRGYHSADRREQENYCWAVSVEAGAALARIKNHSIGVLLTDTSNGVELNEAVKRYEEIVAPSNYKRPKAIFTKKMVSDAQDTVEQLGFSKSLGRRHATLGDITVNNILFANRDAAKEMQGDVFAELADSVPEKVQNFGRVGEVTARDFVTNILPKAVELELLLENGHDGNLVSLIAPKDPDSPTMFKWNNGFSWAYSGNITDSMKQRVKSHGGNIEGVLRFSIQWNERGDCLDDLDAHCKEPSGYHIYFSNKQHPSTTGALDVDIIHPKGAAVENITWTDPERMEKGKYKFYVNDYSHRGGKSGFTAEIEFDGKIYSFEYPKPLRQDQIIEVAEVEFDGDKFSIKPILSTEESSREIWGLNTNSFYPVSAVMYSPNYWDEQEGIGHRHYLFLLKGCRNPESPNGFFNEFLKEELLVHKRVFEALGAKMRVEPSDDQLSGLGFSSTKRASVTVRVKGSFTRVVRITF